MTDYYRAKSDDWTPSPIGKVRIINANYINGKSFVVRVKKAETLSGQTMFFKILAELLEKNESVKIARKYNVDESVVTMFQSLIKRD